MCAWTSLVGQRGNRAGQFPIISQPTATARQRIGKVERTIIDWLRILVVSVTDSVHESIGSMGRAFCALFVASAVACTIVAGYYGDDWDSQRPIGTAANISGASFAIAVISVSIGGAFMLARFKFKNKSKEEGRQEGREEALRAVRESDPTRLPNRP